MSAWRTTEANPDGSTQVSAIGLGAVSLVDGTGTPEAAVTAPVGSLYLRSDGGVGTTVYTKESGVGNTGWVTVAGGAASSLSATLAVGADANNVAITGLNTFTFTGGATIVDDGFGAVSIPGAGLRSVAIGATATAPLDDSVSVGYQGTPGLRAVAIGYQAGALGSGTNSVSVGYQAAAGPSGVGIGREANANGTSRNIAIGQAAVASGSDTIALGYAATSTKDNQFVVGANTAEVVEMVIGEGVSNATPIAQTLWTTTNGVGTDIVGTNLILQSGNSTGAGAVSEIGFNTPDVGTTGTLEQTAVRRLTLSEAGVNLATHQVFGTDNTYDIGSADGGTTLLSPRTIYVGTSLVLGDTGTRDANLTYNGTSMLTLAVHNGTNYNNLNVVSSTGTGALQFYDSSGDGARILNSSNNGYVLYTSENPAVTKVQFGDSAVEFSTAYGHGSKNGFRLYRGNHSPIPFYNPPATAAAPYTLTTEEQNNINCNVGATEIAHIKLPGASRQDSTGAVIGFTTRYRFLCSDAFGIRILPSGSNDTITIGGVTSLDGTGGGYIETTDVGAYVELVCTDNDTFVAINFHGVWNVDGVLVQTVASAVSATGVLSLDSTTNAIETDATSITADAALSITTTTTSALTLDSGTTGAVNLGTNANAKTVTIGNVTGATGVVYNAGSGGHTFTGNLGFYGATPVAQSAAYTRNATIVTDRTLLASASATTINNNNVLAAIVADLQAVGLFG